MTENEAISAIQNDLEWHSKELKPKYKKVLEYAIQALEKVQQFEAIGTIEEFKDLKEIDEDLRLKYCYEDLSSAENRGYMKGSNEAVDEFANFLHRIAKENNGLRLSSETKSWTHPCIFDYLEEFKNEQTCKEET